MSEPVNHHGSRLETSPRETVRELAGEIATLREELAGLVAELDRRRHEALDVKLQVKRHGVEMALTAAALVAAAAGFVWLGAWRSRRRENLLSRGAKLRRAFSRIIDKPDRVGAEPSVAAKILAATSSAAAATLVKKVLDRGLEAALNLKGGGPPRLLRSLVGRGNGADRRGAIARFRTD
jgi:hypothetical protein